MLEAVLPMRIIRAEFCQQFVKCQTHQSISRCCCRTQICQLSYQIRIKKEMANIISKTEIKQFNQILKGTFTELTQLPYSRVNRSDPSLCAAKCLTTLTSLCWGSTRHASRICQFSPMLDLSVPNLDTVKSRRSLNKVLSIMRTPPTPTHPPHCPFLTRSTEFSLSQAHSAWLSQLTAVWQTNPPLHCHD